jgi:hypothetical protein
MYRLEKAVVRREVVAERKAALEILLSTPSSLTQSMLIDFCAFHLFHLPLQLTERFVCHEHYGDGAK